MISTFGPCLSFITGSSANGSLTPTSDCCDSMKSLISSSMDCACLIITASVPVQLPINRTLAISLPKACNMAGVPVGCKSSATPLPAPGPTLLGPSPSPEADSPDYSPLTPRASKAVATSPGPQSGSTDDEGSSPAASPTTSPRIRPVMNPSSSAATHSHITLPFTLLIKCEKLKDQKSFTVFKGYEEKAIFGMERENNESKRSGVETDQDKGKYLQATDSSIRINQEVKDVQKHNDIKYVSVKNKAI
ncbi:hypothetical protein ACFE04_031468 [Oxalis oulophora]